MSLLLLNPSDTETEAVVAKRPRQPALLEPETAQQCEKRQKKKRKSKASKFKIVNFKAMSTADQLAYFETFSSSLSGLRSDGLKESNFVDMKDVSRALPKLAPFVRKLVPRLKRRQARADPPYEPPRFARAAHALIRDYENSSEVAPALWPAQGCKNACLARLNMHSPPLPKQHWQGVPERRPCSHRGHGKRKEGRWTHQGTQVRDCVKYKMGFDPTQGGWGTSEKEGAVQKKEEDEVCVCVCVCYIWYCTTKTKQASPCATG